MNKNKGILYAVAAALIWSSGGVFIKLTDAPGIYIAMGRSLIAGLTFLPFVKLKKIKFSFNLVLLLLCYSGTLIGFVMATKLTTAANAIVLQYTAPIWLFVLYLISKKENYKDKLMPVTLTFIGIVIFLIEPKTGTNMTGNFIALGSGMAFAGVAHFTSKDHGISGPGLISLCNFATFVLALPFTENVINTTLNLSVISILGILILGIFQIGVGYVFYIKSLKIISPIDTSLICLLEPLANPVWVFIFISEIPTAYALFGSVFILLGIAVNILKQKRRKSYSLSSIPRK